MKRDSIKNINAGIDWVFIPLLAALSILLGMAMLASLKWRMCWDLPVLTYPAFAADRFGLMPYRDIFDVNMPGTYFIHYLWGHFLGYTDYASRLADMAYLCLLMASIVFMLRRLSGLVAWSSAILFGLTYLQLGKYFSMQREYLILPMIALGAGSVLAFPKRHFGWRAALTGLLFGLAACIKPHAGIGLVPILAFLYLDTSPASTSPQNRLRRAITIAAFAGLGLAVPIGCAFIFMLWKGILGSFLDMAYHYWPLYGSLSQKHRILEPGTKLPYIWDHYKTLGNYVRWHFPALFGLFAALAMGGYDQRKKRYIVLLGVLAFCYTLYPAIQGQFFNYHWIPFLMFLVVLTSLNLSPSRADANPLIRLIPLAVLLLVVFGQSNAAERFAKLFPAPPDTKEPYDRMADFLKENLKAGDTVQPLDWVSGGVLQAMLIAEAKVATPFIYDFSFYHHVSNPYIQQLRRRFIQDLTAASPRFILQAKLKAGKSVSGPDTSFDFPELKQILAKQYRAVLQGKKFTIFERIDSINERENAVGQ